MNSEERQLITGLFDRIRSQGPIDKDRDADNLIMQGFRQNPDAAYLMVQSVLVQDHALQLSEQKMQELEQQVADLEQQLASRQPQQSSGGSFLGGLFGGGAASRPAPQAAGGMSRSSAGFGAPAGRDTRMPQQASGSSPWGQPAGAPPQPAPAAGGGFMKQAMTTAAGVAGGMLAANAISNMLGGGGSAHAAQSANKDSNSAFDDTSNANDYSSASDNDPGYTDAGYDDSAGGWGDDDIEV
ncbi:MAG: DUF2076 domain-containing protein [Hyphomicrobiaceae bacterium]